MLTEEDTTKYYQTLPIIEQNSRFFPQKELKDIYTYIKLQTEITTTGTIFNRGWIEGKLAEFRASDK